MAAHTSTAEHQANSLRLLSLHEDELDDGEFSGRTRGSNHIHRGVHLRKYARERWQAIDTQTGTRLDEFWIRDYREPRDFLNHVNRLAQHGREYLDIVEAHE